jgi:tyrosine-protein kinase Etk/Wzc
MKNTDQRSNGFPAAFENTTTKSAISKLAFRYLPFWPIFAITIVICLIISHFYLHYQTPIYSAGATILLKEKQATNNDVLASLDVTGNTIKSVDNEIEILKSRTLMREVAREMGLYAQIYAKGALRDIMVYPNPVKFVALNPDALPNTGNIPINLDHALSGHYVTLAGKNYPFNTPVHTPYGDFIIRPQNVSLEMDAEEGEHKTKKAPLYLQIRSIRTEGLVLLGGLQVAAVGKQSSLISLKFDDQVAVRAEDILNNLIHVYNKAGVDDKNGTVANTLEFINNRLVTVTKDLNDVEGDLQKFKTANGIVDISGQGKDYLEKINQNDASISQIQLQLDVLNEVQKYVQQKADNAGTVPATVGITDPLLNTLLDRLYTSELEIDRQRQTAGESSPTIVSLKGQIAQIKQSILENINNLRQNLMVTRSGIQSEINKNSGLLKTVPETERALLEIDRQQSVKNSIYTFLLQKREDAEISLASAVADCRIVNPAESSGSPIKPVAANIYLIGLAVGVMAGVFFVLVREQFNRSVLFRSDIEAATGATILAEIMHDESGEQLVIKDGKRTTIAEQLRALRTSLNYIGIQGDKKTILLTSSISGEGKSFMGVNMAVSLSLTGKKVALLEFDLRKPKVSRMLEITQEPGISNYLAGLAKLEDIIIDMKDREIPGLYILPAGTIPPNPTELMLNGKLDELMEYLKKTFDYVVIDSPPVGLVTDAKILNKYANATLYMVRHNYTPKHYLNLIEQLYASDELTNLNIVFNGLRNRGILSNYKYGYGGGYSYGYGYGAGYGYGYTQESESRPDSKLRLRRRKKQHTS